MDRYFRWFEHIPVADQRPFGQTINVDERGYEIVSAHNLPGRIAGRVLCQVEPWGKLSFSGNTIRAPWCRPIAPVLSVDNAMLRRFAADCVTDILREMDLGITRSALIWTAIRLARQATQTEALLPECVKHRALLWQSAAKEPVGAYPLILEAAGDLLANEAWAAARYAALRAAQAYALVQDDPGAMQPIVRSQQVRFQAALRSVSESGSLTLVGPETLAQQGDSLYL